MAKRKALLTKEEFDALDKGRQEDYVQEGDHYVIDLEDKDFKSKLGEFRNNNLALQKKQAELEEALKPYKGLDVARITKAMEQLANLEKDEEGKLIAAGKWDEVFKHRTATMQASHDAAMAAKEGALKEATRKAEERAAKLSRYTLERAVRDEVTKASLKVRDRGWKDLLTRASETFSVGEDDKLKPAADLFGKDGSPLTLSEWVTRIPDEASHLVEAAAGSGAGGSGANGDVSRRTVPNDPRAIGKNLEDIAKGKIRVAP